MQTGAIRGSVLVMAMLVIAGCRGSRSADKEITPIPPPQPFVFYDETGDPSERTPALSELELRKIIDWVATRTPDPVWLIHVHPSPGFFRPPPLRRVECGWIKAYLVPDKTTPRFRTGRYYLPPEPEVRTGDRSPSTYVQVSMPDRRFTEHFAMPSAAELPFYRPVDPAPDDPISEEELIAIVDFVRRPSSHEELADRGEMSRDEMVRTILEAPIQHMFREGDKIVVHFGFQHAPLWGYGLAVGLKCTPTGYKIAGWSKWMS